jgi:hypothetical protein
MSELHRPHGWEQGSSGGPQEARSAGPEADLEGAGLAADQAAGYKFMNGDGGHLRTCAWRQSACQVPARVRRFSQND